MSVCGLSLAALNICRLSAVSLGECGMWLLISLSLAVFSLMNDHHMTAELSVVLGALVASTSDASGSGSGSE